jgi:hypothetical protein
MPSKYYRKKCFRCGHAVAPDDKKCWYCSASFVTHRGTRDYWKERCRLAEDLLDLFLAYGPENEQQAVAVEEWKDFIGNAETDTDDGEPC